MGEPGGGRRIESIDASDHFAPWSEEGQAPFVWTWLGAAASKTSSIGLGTGLTCPILRYHPVIIAQAAATLERIAPGRTYLCVGTGEALNEYAATAIWPGYTERQAMLAEAIDLIRRLWTGEEVTFQGEYYETRKARLWTRPERSIPLYISALVPQSAAFAGRHGDGLITVGGQKPEIYREMNREFEQGAREAGKDSASMPRLIELNVSLNEDEDAAIESMLKYWAGTFVPALFNRKIYSPKESAQNGEVIGPDMMRQKMCLSPPIRGDTSTLRGSSSIWASPICTSTTPMRTMPGSSREYGRTVLPAIRELGSRVAA